MNQMIEYEKTYKQFKEELDGVLLKAAEGFVKIGYLLKVARDTNVLAESGYKSVAEFAEAEYNLNRTQVSRFISINDKFSEDGYSDHLLPSYQGFGYAKLTIMLQLPDSINEELSPNFSKSEIQAVKEEVEAENRVTDIERYIEAPNPKESNLEDMDSRGALINRTILQLAEDEAELFISISDRRNEDMSIVLPEVMAPGGDKIYSIRVRGIGRMMISISDMSDYIKLINSRTGDKETYTWADVAAAWSYAGVLDGESGIEAWEKRFERKCPIQPKVDKPTETKKVEAKKVEAKEEKTQKKESKVVKAKTEWESAYKVGQQIVVNSNNTIGELVAKTDTSGKWKVKFSNYSAELTEMQFRHYEPQNTVTGPDVSDSKVESHDEAIMDVLMSRIETIRKHIQSKDWAMALIDIDLLIDDINITKNIESTEDDE